MACPRSNHGNIFYVKATVLFTFDPEQTITTTVAQKIDIVVALPVPLASPNNPCFLT